jgi:hypothetical protein
LVAVPDFDDLGVPLDEAPVAAAAGTAGVDSESVPDDPDSLDGPPSDVDVPLSDAVSSLPPDAAPVLTAARRSFFAQPEPL